MAEARQRFDAGNGGPDFDDLMLHVRDLHVLIGEELTAAGRNVGEYAGGLYAAMGDKLKELEALMRKNA